MWLSIRDTHLIHYFVSDGPQLLHLNLDLNFSEVPGFLIGGFVLPAIETEPAVKFRSKYKLPHSLWGLKTGLLGSGQTVFYILQCRKEKQCKMEWGILLVRRIGIVQKLIH